MKSVLLVIALALAVTAEAQTPSNVGLGDLLVASAAQHQPPLARVAELFTRVDSRILTTFAELDHYQNRPGAEYWGVLSDWRGAAPAWPSGGRPRVLAYLQPAPVVGQLLGELARRGFSTLAYVPRSPAAAGRMRTCVANFRRSAFVHSA